MRPVVRSRCALRPLDVGIIGGGTAGSAAAIFLARAGHSVTLYERVAKPGAVGAGITLQPTGLHVLQRLGLHAHVVARGSQIDRLHCQTVGRRTVTELTYASIAEGLFGVGIHRGVLFEALASGVRTERRVSVRNGVEVVSLARDEAREPRRDAGRASWLVDHRGGRHGPHELVVVADGARSQLRDDTGTWKRTRRYPWGALWFVARDPRSEDAPEARVLHQVVDGSGTFLGLLPTGRPPAGDERFADGSTRLVSLFWSIRGDRVDAWRARGLGAWKREVAAVAPEAVDVVEQIDDIDQVLYASYHDVVMNRWATRNVVYLGDAAHATSPQLGQGANLALWDAMVLADSLEAEERHLACALDAYSRAREAHLGFYQLATRWLTPFFQSDQRALGALRDVVMPVMTKVPLLRRIMTLTMLGVVDGFTGRTLPLVRLREPP